MANVVSAGVGRRLGAMAYDGVIVLALWLLITIIHLAFFRLILSQPVEAVGASALAVWSLRGLLLLSTTGFFCFFWQCAGMTLGMQAWRLRVQTIDGQTITLRQSLIRCGIAWLSLALFGLGYWWVLLDSRQRSWPDIASQTRTVFVPDH
ncbi:RDD family protein [Halomonas sp. AOP43-A1-21]|uniref:RDD family protein n=1 Tax=Halomonas colorata TaxID=2742615 RepID=UPI001866F582|nr:RDD family protein [Halomonas colorata]